VEIWSVGHGARPIAEFLELLTEARIETLVDIRSFPGSRRHPQFGAKALATSVGDRGITYEHLRALGGRREPRDDSPHRALRVAAFRGYADHMRTPAFAAALDRVLAHAAAEPTTVMCSESVWWRCHRRLLSDAAVLLRGVEVVHLMHDGRAQPHRPTEGVRRDGEHLVYDAGQESLIG
jgi:uncharacterized protein (DUF488 family)